MTLLLLGALVPLLTVVSQQPGTTPIESPRLQVLRATPSGDASDRPTIIVIFDRPIAPRLNASVDPATVLSVSPAFAARARWRDPVTVVLQPLDVLNADTRYTVTVSAKLQATDGSRLAAAYKFSFRTPGGCCSRPGWPTARPGSRVSR